LWQQSRCLPIQVTEHLAHEPDVQRQSVSRTGSGAAAGPLGLAPGLLSLQRAAGNGAVGRLLSVQRRMEAYDPSNFSSTRPVDFREALRYLTPDGGSLSEGQVRWLADVTEKLKPKTLEDGVRELDMAPGLVDFADHQPNSAAVAILSALDKAPTPKTDTTSPPRVLTPKERSELSGKKPTTSQPRTEKKKRFTTLDVSDQTAEWSSLPGRGLIDPTRVKFSQDTAGFHYSQEFTMGRFKIKTVEEHGRAMKETGDGSGTPPIEIVLFQKRIMSLDNRRLKAHQLGGVPIPYFKSNKWVGDDVIRGHDHVDGPPRNNLTLR
jgi:hypothetical protein